MSEPTEQDAARARCAPSHDGHPCGVCETSVPPTQPPAAPETEADANGLTEAEIAFIYDWAPSTTDRRAAMANDLSDLLAARVERIVAERVRVVEGERDALRIDLATCEVIARRIDARGRSAEAAHRALQAEVEALAADFDTAVGFRGAATSLRALLAGGGEER